MGEKLINFWLQIKSYLRFFLRFKPNLKKPDDIKNYPLSFSDFFIGNKIDLLKWRIGQPWGSFHPSYPYQYYGETEEFVEVRDGYLNLYSLYKPKKFVDFKNSTYITIPYGIGLVVSNNSFKYGYYEIIAELPTGILLWPAIWLTAVKTWPPEIDILEAYSGKEGKYKNEIGINNFKIQPNIHYGFVENKTKSSYGAKSYPLINSTKRDIAYSLHWTENFIKIYYDGYLVFKTSKKNILDYFNKEEVRMNIILNNGFQSSIDGKKYEPSNFKIKSVKFFSKN